MNRERFKIIRATTIPMSLRFFCDGMLKELSEKYEVIALSSPGEDLRLVADREDVKTVAVPMERRISFFKDIKSLVKLISVFKKEGPTMVHSMTPKAGLLCMVAGKLTGVPVRVHTFTGLVWPTESGLKRRILMFADRLTCACATHIIPEGEGVKNDLIAGRITKKPLKVLGFGNVKGIDLTQYVITDELKSKSEMLRSEKFTFLFVGRIVRDKGINELVEAFNKLSQTVDARLLLIGPYEDTIDPISEHSRELIEKNPTIESLGAKYGEELLSYYAASDCFVFPSYREGFPNTVIEAGAMNLPSIVTDINGSREIIVDGENGIIVPSQNTDALFDAMLNMVNNREERERMASNARKMVADRYEQSFVRKCLYDFYDEILQNIS